MRVPKYGEEPRASTLARSNRASGTPTSASPSAMRVTGGTPERPAEDDEDGGPGEPTHQDVAEGVERDR